jgi:hypothetical protein
MAVSAEPVVEDFGQQRRDVLAVVDRIDGVGVDRLVGIPPAARELPGRKVVHVFDDHVPALRACERRIGCMHVGDGAGKVAHLGRRHLMAVDAIHDELGFPRARRNPVEPGRGRRDVDLVVGRLYDQRELEGLGDAAAVSLYLEIPTGALVA